MARLNAAFRCINECGEHYALDDVIYTCPQCGGLLEVWHDLDALQQKSGAEWRTCFDQRVRMRAQPTWGLSGIWSKREWVLPEVNDENIVSLAEGFAPLLPAGQLGATFKLDNLWLKLCGTSHSGSFKDLGMTVLVSQVKQMIADGKNIRAIACASTGDTSAALAAYCAAAGIPAVVLLPENKISTAQLIQPIAHGALTLALQTDFDGCMRLVQELTKRPEIYLANSMNSLRIEGQKTIAVELCQQFEWQVPPLFRKQTWKKTALYGLWPLLQRQASSWHPWRSPGYRARAPDSYSGHHIDPGHRRLTLSGKRHRPVRATLRAIARRVFAASRLLGYRRVFV